MKIGRYMQCQVHAHDLRSIVRHEQRKDLHRERQSSELTSNTHLDAAQNEVVLVNDSGHVLGSMPKKAVHNVHTPLHLGFSVYVFNDEHLLLMTKRSSKKLTWPSVWSNSFCGHPAPGENFRDAISRHARQELNIALEDITPVLPRFRYSCTMQNGLRENELCPVFRATTTDQPRLNSLEVDDAAWMEWEKVVLQLFISPWARLQIAELDKLGSPAAWPQTAWNLLPGIIE
jgi:isopentenyl-diphosphate delta-isomerase